MAEHRSSSPAGRQFGDYRILSPLGAGGMGAVYAAEDMRLHRKVAIKFLTSESLGDAEAKRRLFHEARAAAAIDHPNICTIYDVGEAEGQAFIVMQYVEGQTLAARLISGPVGVDQAIDVAAEVATALVEAHDRGIVHRDVKPRQRGRNRLRAQGLKPQPTTWS
jgi:serine/threonine protein kinase